MINPLNSTFNATLNTLNATLNSTASNSTTNSMYNRFSNSISNVTALDAGMMTVATLSVMVAAKAARDGSKGINGTRLANMGVAFTGAAIAVAATAIAVLNK